jgi:predicted kinase
LVVFVNGAFGIGKTTVARLLRARLPGGALYDLELLGLVLRRVPAFVPLEGRGSDDFQDLALWRRGSLRGIRVVRALRRTVIVPMAFSNLAYLRELTAGVARFDARVRHFCLPAPFAVVRARLEERGLDPTSPAGAGQLRRAAECCAAHAASGFSEQTATEDASPADVAAAIAARLPEG